MNVYYIYINIICIYIYITVYLSLSLSHLYLGSTLKQLCSSCRLNAKIASDQQPNSSRFVGQDSRSIAPNAKRIKVFIREPRSVHSSVSHADHHQKQFVSVRNCPLALRQGSVPEIACTWVQHGVFLGPRISWYLILGSGIVNHL